MKRKEPSGHISVTMPTWPTRLRDTARPEKNTRSPGCRFSVSICVPWVYWLREVGLSATPNWRNTYDVKPEQSNPPGALPAPAVACADKRGCVPQHVVYVFWNGFFCFFNRVYFRNFRFPQVDSGNQGVVICLYRRDSVSKACQKMGCG